MQGKTHLVTATATALMVVRPLTTNELLLTLVASGIGGLMPDIDIKSSDVSKDTTRVISILTVLFTTAAFVDMFCEIGLMTKITSNSDIMRMFIGLSILVCNCFAGKNQPHRGYTHSFLCMVSMSAGVCLMIPGATASFMIGYTSHILIDMLNKKRVRLMFPLKEGFCLKVCKSDGYVNNALYYVCAITTIAISFMVWSIERSSL